MKKNISGTIKIKRYRPLWDVLDPQWNDAWDEDKKLEVILAGDDWPSRIDFCVDNDLLSTDLVLGRIKEFVSQKPAPEKGIFPNDNFDLDAACSSLEKSLGAINELKKANISFDNNTEKLLLLMFELGCQTAAINMQDMSAKGYSSIRQVKIRQIESEKVRSLVAHDRKSAFFELFNKIKCDGIKVTKTTVINYLLSLENKFTTTVKDGKPDGKLIEIGIAKTTKKISDSVIGSVSETTLNRWIGDFRKTNNLSFVCK